MVLMSMLYLNTNLETKKYYLARLKKQIARPVTKKISKPEILVFGDLVAGYLKLKTVESFYCLKLTIVRKEKMKWTL